MEEQKDRARKASKFSGDLMAEDSWHILKENVRLSLSVITALQASQMFYVTVK